MPHPTEAARTGEERQRSSARCPTCVEKHSAQESNNTAGALHLAQRENHLPFNNSVGGRVWPKLERTPPNFGRTRPTLERFLSNSAEFGPESTYLERFRANSGRTRPNWVRFRRDSAISNECDPWARQVVESMITPESSVDDILSAAVCRTQKAGCGRILGQEVSSKEGQSAPGGLPPSSSHHEGHRPLPQKFLLHRRP